jgi:hypothetical protein
MNLWPQPCSGPPSLFRSRLNSNGLVYSEAQASQTVVAASFVLPPKSHVEKQYQAMSCGHRIAVPRARACARAVLYPGQGHGKAVSDLLRGEKNRFGRHANPRASR